MADEPDVVLVLRVLPDPNGRDGIPERDGDYRLKLLLKIALRQLGLRCVEVRNRSPVDKTPTRGRQDISSGRESIQVPH